MLQVGPFGRYSYPAVSGLSGGGRRRPVPVRGRHQDPRYRLHHSGESPGHGQIQPAAGHVGEDGGVGYGATRVWSGRRG